MQTDNEQEWQKDRRAAEERAGEEPTQPENAAGGEAEWQKERAQAEQRQGGNSNKSHPDQPPSNLQRQPD